MSELTPKQIEQIQKAVKSGVELSMDAKLKDFWVEREKHFLDHEFVNGVRDGIKTARKAGIGGLALAFLGFLGWAIKTWLISLFQKGGA